MAESVRIFDANSACPEFPPQCAAARLIVIKPNIGYAAPPPAIVRPALLEQIVRLLRETNPRARLVLLEGICGKGPFSAVMERAGLPALLAPYDVEIRDADEEPGEEFVNPCEPFRFRSLWAPRLLRESGFTLSVAPLKRTVLQGAPLISASVKNLYGLMPRSRYRARSPYSRGQLHHPDIHRAIVDVWNTLGPSIHFAVVDVAEKFVSRGWEPDKGRGEPVGIVAAGPWPPAVDAAACRAAGEPLCRYQQMIPNSERTPNVDARDPS